MGTLTMIAGPKSEGRAWGLGSQVSRTRKKWTHEAGQSRAMQGGGARECVCVCESVCMCICVQAGPGPYRAGD